MSVVQKEPKEFSISHISPLVSHFNMLSPFNDFVIVIFTSCLLGLFNPGGLKNINLKPLIFFSSGKESGQVIEVITSLFVKLKRQIGTEIPFKSFVSSKFLVL